MAEFFATSPLVDSGLVVERSDDTDVVSEWVKPRPGMLVVRWLDEVDEEQVHLSALTLGELREGVDRLVPGRRRADLDRWLTLVTRNVRDVADLGVPLINPWAD